MPLKIKIAPAGGELKEKKPIQASVGLQISKTLDGNLLVNDHQYLDIVIAPPQKKIFTIPKPYVERDVFEYQRDIMYDLFKGGIANKLMPEGGIGFGIVETTYTESDEIDPIQAILYRLSEYFRKTAHNEEKAEEYDENIEDRFTDPDASDSTKYGSIPPYQDTPAGKEQGDPTYTFAGYGYYY